MRSQIKTMQKVVNQLFGESGTLEERVQEFEKDFETDANIGQIIQFVRERNRFGLSQPQRAVA